MPKTHSCGCLCGAVRFTVDAPLDRMLACFCDTCRKSSSGGPAYLVLAGRDALTVPRGAARSFEATGGSGQPVRRFFCPRCGTPLWSEPDAMPAALFVSVGAFDTDPGLPVAAQVFTENAPPWHPGSG